MYEHLKAALLHGEAARRRLAKALTLLGCDDFDDDDEPPVEESGLIPPPPEQDFVGPDYVEPTAPLDDDLVNPQSRARVRLVRALASYR
jgi:hypothetical protein